MPEFSIKCPKCGASRLVKEEWAGKNARCACGGSIVIPDVWPVSAPQPSEPSESEEDTTTRLLRQVLTGIGTCIASLERLSGTLLASADNANTRKQYKVLTQKDKWFTGKFDPALLEQAMNAYAEPGWSIKAVTTASIPGFGGNREELVVILER
jgi:hypothetical protein